MKDQLTLLKETPWDVLIILDACRADYFREVADRQARVVHSPGVSTPQWLAHVGPLLQELGVIYLTANPVVDREVNKRGLEIELISLWKYLWSNWRYHWADNQAAALIPSVHPLTVNGAVLQHLSGVQEDRRVVVHYLQPHSPYIGAVPLAAARWGRKDRYRMGWGLWKTCQQLPRPGELISQGKLDWELLRKAYRANVELVWDAAQQLVRQLDCRAVVTADHGEMLGEEIRGKPRFGHECQWRHAKLREVPWLVLEPHHRGTENREKSTQEKLEALGYV